MDQSRPINKYKLFSVGALGTFMATFEGSILNVALPTIAEELSCPIDVVAWVVLGYTLTVIALMLVFGAWTQRMGYAFSYMFGYGFFTVGTLICGLSGSIEWLIFGRVVQATGTAMFAALGPAMVTTVFPKEERGKGLGINVMMVSAGFMIGPPVGGLLLSVWSWQSVFFVAIPFGFIGFFLAGKYFRGLMPVAERRRIVLLGPILMSAALVASVYGLTGIDEYGIGDIHVWGYLIFAAFCAAGFLKFESQPDRALIGLSIFKNRKFVIAIAAQLAHFVAFTGVMVLIPFYLERVRGLEPKEVGLYLVVMPIMLFIFSPLAGKLSDKIGFRFLTSLGLATIAAGLYMLSYLQLETSGAYVILCLSVMGIGAGIFGSPNSSAMMGAVTAGQRPVASAILATNRNIGMSVGVAMSTAFFTFFQDRFADLGDEKVIFVASYQPVIYMAIGVAVVGILISLMRRDK